MQAFRLIELGARIALTGPRLVRGARQLSPTGIHDYWFACRQRFDAWNVSLAAFAPDRQAEAISDPRWASELRPLLEEIFTSELLTRVWTAVGIGFSRCRGETDIEPMLRGILLTHLEIRNLALNRVVFGRGPESLQIDRLHQVRRRVERWIDLLFGEMQREIDVAELSHDPCRARNYARTHRHIHVAGQGHTAVADDRWIESARNSFDGVLSPHTFQPDLNRAVAAGILSSVQGDWLGPLVWYPDHWLERLQCATDDSLLWVDDLLSLDGAARRQ